MPSKAKTQNSKSAKKVTTVPVAVEEPETVVEVIESVMLEVVPPVDKKTSKKRTTKSKTPEPVVVEQVSEVEEEVLIEEHEEPVSTKKTTRSRAVPTKDSVSDECIAMLAMISDEIKSIKEGSRKGTGVQFLNSLSRKLKTHSTNVSRVTKKRQVSKRASSVNSGFLKPVIVSREVAEFAGWNHNDLHSRTDVTKVICNYIKENNLQNPKNRRLIVPDDKLSKLLSFESSSFEDEIRYCDIQRLLKSHFTNPPK